MTPLPASSIGLPMQAFTVSILAIGILAMFTAGCAPREPQVRYEDGLYSRVLERQQAGLPIEEAPTPSAPELSPDEHERLGDRSLRDGNLALALVHYTKTLESRPQHTGVMYKLGLLMLKQGLVDEAAQRFAAMITADPRSAPAHEGMGQAHLARGEDEAAELEFRQSLALDLGQWKVRNYLGILYDRHKRHRDAIAEYHGALALQPDQPALLNNLGLAQYLAGDYEDAVRTFQRALRIGPLQAVTPNNLALAYAKLSRYHEALEAFKEGNDEAQAYNNLGMVLLGAGKPLNAMACFEKAIELQPRYYGKARENLSLAQHEATVHPPSDGTVARNHSASCP